MLSSRTKKIAIAMAFVSEYANFRETSWSSTTQRAISWAPLTLFVPLPDTVVRREACKKIKKSIYTADAAETLIRIIYEIAALAREAQAAQTVTKDSYLVGFFAEDSSLFAKTLHAVRTCLVSILKTDYVADYEQEVAGLKAELDKREKLLAIDVKKKLNLSILKNERNAIYNKLLDMQDIGTIHHACINDKFPASLPVVPRDVTADPDPNVPVVYMDDYYYIYHQNDIICDLKRQAFFRGEVKRVQSLQVHAENKNQDILDEMLKEDEVSSFNVEGPLSDRQRRESHEHLEIPREENTYEMSGHWND